MNKFKHRFTVFTPCYNSEKFLERVFKSLKNQTFKDFEWYVINDNSNDRTHELIEEYIKTVDFDVVYCNLKKNQGLLNNYNQAIKDAQGEFFVSYGHDDEITPDALETFDFLLKKYDSPKISAVYALANDQKGKLVGKKYIKDELVSDYWTEFFVLNNESEKFQCFKTDYLRKFYPIPTGKEDGMPSSWLWGKLGANYKAIFVNKVLRTYYMDVLTSITKVSKRDSNPQSIFNYYQEWVNEFQYLIKGNLKRRFKGIAGYVSYGLLSKKTLKEMISPINKFSNKMYVLLFYPIAYFYNKKNNKKC